MKTEEQFLYQKAKIQWISLGDRSNAFFHQTLKSRNHKRRISAVQDEMGNKVEGEEVSKQFVKHFEQFLGKQTSVVELPDLDNLFINKLTDSEAEYMVTDVSDAEIKKAMFSIDNNKAPGPDGFSSLFYKKAWDVIGNDVCLAVKEFFETGKILNEINSTLIAQVPKTQTTAKVSDYRPIACCNVIYKCISMLITE